MGVVTGIPMEFQFGTNWARFSTAAGGVIGQTLAMEGVFAFFLESTFLGLFLFGERRFGPRVHWFAAVRCCARAPGSRATSSSPRTPGCSTRSATRRRDGVAPARRASGRCSPTRGSPWQYAAQHDRLGGHRGVRGGGVGAYYLLARQHEEHGADSSCGSASSLGLVASFADGVPDRRRPGQERRAAPAGDAGGDGGPVRDDRRARRWSSSGSRTWSGCASTTRSRCRAC